MAISHKKTINLNALTAETDGTDRTDRPRMSSCRSEVFKDCLVEVVFDDIEHRLCSLIRRADLVLGCMAWLTNRRVLAALSQLSHGCQFVVQKEDFLRPGPVVRDELQRMYGRLRCGFERHQLPFGAHGLSMCGDPTVDAIRCMGVVPDRKGQTVPRMHHKFGVLCQVVERDVTDDFGDPGVARKIAPFAVWTGSFNATENATRSRENVLIIDDRNAAVEFGHEWSRVFALSEPLDWSSDYVEPEWRFGT